MLFLLTNGDESTTTSLSINSGLIRARRRPMRPPKLWPEKGCSIQDISEETQICKRKVWYLIREIKGQLGQTFNIKDLVDIRSISTTQPSQWGPGSLPEVSNLRLRRRVLSLKLNWIAQAKEERTKKTFRPNSSHLIWIRKIALTKERNFRSLDLLDEVLDVLGHGGVAHDLGARTVAVIPGVDWEHRPLGDVVDLLHG